MQSLTTKLFIFVLFALAAAKPAREDFSENSIENEFYKSYGEIKAKPARENFPENAIKNYYFKGNREVKYNNDDYESYDPDNLNTVDEDTSEWPREVTEGFEESSVASAESEEDVNRHTLASISLFAASWSSLMGTAAIEGYLNDKELKIFKDTKRWRVGVTEEALATILEMQVNLMSKVFMKTVFPSKKGEKLDESEKAMVQVFKYIINGEQPYPKGPLSNCRMEDGNSHRELVCDSIWDQISGNDVGQQQVID